MNDFVIGAGTGPTLGLHCTRNKCDWWVDLTSEGDYTEVSLNEVRVLAAEHTVREHGYA